MSSGSRSSSGGNEPVGIAIGSVIIVLVFVVLFYLSEREDDKRDAKDRVTMSEFRDDVVAVGIENPSEPTKVARWTTEDDWEYVFRVRTTVLGCELLLERSQYNPPVMATVQGRQIEKFKVYSVRNERGFYDFSEEVLPNMNNIKEFMTAKGETVFPCLELPATKTAAKK